MRQIMTHLVAGYPNEEASEKIALSMAEEGVHFLEIQIPFSDPIADGPTIYRANQEAIKNGMSTEKALKMIERIKTKISEKTNIVVMTYANIPFQYGLEKFCARLGKIGVMALILPDIPLDEEPFEHYVATCRKNGVHPIQIVSPITPPDRLEKIADNASGFIYCVSHTGKTGVQKTLDEDTLQYLERVREKVKIPLALGFGISSTEQVEAAFKRADIVVMGSFFIQLYDKEGLAGIKSFLRKIHL